MLKIVAFAALAILVTLAPVLDTRSSAQLRNSPALGLTLALSANPAARSVVLDVEKPCNLHGLCSALGGGTVTLGAGHTTPATKPAPHRGSPRSGAAPMPEPESAPVDRKVCVILEFHNRDCYPDDADLRAAITIQDFVTFGAAAGTPHIEPGAWAVLGLPTNFYANAARHTRTGTLLRLPAAAEFTPIAYSWNYGDGTTARTNQAGNSWRSLGLPEFAQTSTSHIYTTRGNYPVTLTTVYSVRAAFADGTWWDVPGQLSIASAPSPIQVVGVKTVLVNKNCVENPTGPGC